MDKPSEEGGQVPARQSWEASCTGLRGCFRLTRTVNSPTREQEHTATETLLVDSLKRKWCHSGPVVGACCWVVVCAGNVSVWLYDVGVS